MFSAILETTLLAFSMSAVLASPAPVEGPAKDAHRHGVAEASGPRVSFDAAVGASASTPRVVGLEQAHDDKQALDEAISPVPVGPQVQVMAGARVYPQGRTGLELQVTATQSWSLKSYGRKRVEAAQAETAVLEVEARAEALERQLAAAHAWILLRAAERQLELAEAELAAVDALGDLLEEGVALGVGTRADVADARARAAAAELRAGQLRGDVHDLGLVLAREVGGDTSQPLQTEGADPSPELPSEAELRATFAAVESLPQVARQRVLARAARARAVEVEARQSTGMYAGASVQREAESDTVVFGVLGVNISTSHGERQRGTAIAEAREAEAEAEAEVLALEAVLTTAIHDLHHSQSQIEILEQHTLPAHRELVESRAGALELGEGTRPLVLDAESRLHAVEREYAAARAEWIWARVQAWLYYQAILAEGGQ